MQSGAEAGILSLRLILVLLASLTALMLFSWFSQPGGGAIRTINQMECRIVSNSSAASTAHRVTLPLSSGTDMNAADRKFICTTQLELSRKDATTTALLIPSYAEAIELLVNGRRVSSGEVQQLRTVRYSTRPALFSLNQIADEGLNHIELRVSSKFGRDILLDRIFVGPDTQLRPDFKRRWMLAATLPTLAAGAALALSMVFGAIWWNRRQESAYGWLAMLLLFSGQHGSILIPDFLPSSDRAFWALSTLWAVSANVMFVRRLFDLPNRRSEWLLFIPPLLVSLITITAPKSIAVMLVLPGASVTFLLYALYALFLLARAGLKRNREAQFFLLVEVIVLAIAIHDVLISVQAISNAQFYARLGATIFLVAPVLLMIRRKTLAMNELDHTAATLRSKITEVEQELQRSYETLREQREALLIGQERARMMRDLHDGMSGDIVSMMALAERIDPDVPQIARHARNALMDMRLIVSSLEDYGGDLSLALGVWRERMEPQVRAASIRLKWHVDDLPAQDWLSPSHVLDILRILQEAVTNAVRHSGATTIEVDCRLAANRIRITIGDDGHGCPSDKLIKGKGLVNMSARATRLGASLDIRMATEGTRVELLLDLAPAGRAMQPLTLQPT